MEANIIYRISRGDEKALDIFMDHYSAILYRIAYSVIGNKEISEEVVSDVFVDIWRARHKILEIESLNAYMSTLAYNKAVSHIRSEGMLHGSEISFDEINDCYMSPVVSPDEEIVSKEEAEEINEAIDSLPAKCKRVFMLAKLEGMNYKDISSMLGISVATINYHIKFAVDTLKTRLGKRKPPG